MNSYTPLDQHPKAPEVQYQALDKKWNETTFMKQPALTFTVTPHTEHNIQHF